MKKPLVCVLAKVLEKSDFDKKLKSAILQWADDKKDALVKLYSEHKDFFPKVTCKKKLYRGMALFEDDYVDFIEGTKLRTSNLFESWTTSKQAALYFMKLRLDEDYGNYGIILCKKPNKLIININDIIKGDWLYKKEQEYLALSEPHSIDDVIEVYDDDFNLL